VGKKREEGGGRRREREGEGKGRRSEEEEKGRECEISKVIAGFVLESFQSG
jgi:hypothetical protein